MRDILISILEDSLAIKRQAVTTQLDVLIARFGYVRARWLAEPESQEWRDADRLLRQIDLLRDEPRLMPPPDDHVH